MATDLGQLVYTLTLNDEGFQGQLGSASAKVKESGSQMSGSMKETEGQSSKLGGAFSSMAGQFIIGSAIFTVAQKALGFLTDQVHEGVKSFEQWQINQAQINNSLKVTGDASGQTTKSLNAYADALTKQTGISGNAINSAQLVMLNYKAIGKDIFPEATKQVANFATVLSHGAVPSQDQMNAAAKKLGTALEDPAKGMMKLKIAGIVLTQDQQTQIKNMEKQGNLAGAQKTLLSDVADIIGGKAATASHTLAGEQAKLHAELEGVQIAVGQKLTAALHTLEPVLAETLAWLMKIGDSKFIKDSLKDIGDAFNYIKVVVGLFFEALTGGDPTLKKGQDKFAEWAKILSQFGHYFDEFRTALKLIWEVISGGDPTLDKNHLQMAKFVEILLKVKEVVIDLAKGVISVFKTAWDVLKIAVEGLMPSIKSLISAFVSQLKPTLIEVWQTIMRLWQALNPALMDALKVIAVIVGVVVYAAIYLFINSLRVFIEVSGFVIRALSDVIKWLANLIGWIGDVVSFVVNHWKTIVEIITGPVGWIIAIWSNFHNQIKAGFQDSWNFVTHLWSGIVGFFQSIWHGISGAVGQVGGVLKSVFRDAFNAIIGLWDDTMGKLFHGQRISVGPAHFDLPNLNIPRMAAGGIVNTATLALIGEAGPEAVVPLNKGNNPMGGQTTYNFQPGSVILSTAEAVDEFFSIGNRNTALELNGMSPLAGTTGV